MMMAAKTVDVYRALTKLGADLTAFYVSLFLSSEQAMEKIALGPPSYTWANGSLERLDDKLK